MTSLQPAVCEDFNSLDKQEVDRVKHLANHLIFRGGVIEPHFQGRSFPKDQPLLGKRLADLWVEFGDPASFLIITLLVNLLRTAQSTA